MLTFNDTFHSLTGFDFDTESVDANSAVLQECYLPLNADGLNSTLFASRILAAYQQIYASLAEKWTVGVCQYDLGCHIRRHHHLHRGLDLALAIDPIRETIQRLSDVGRVRAIYVAADDEACREMIGRCCEQAADRVVVSSAPLTGSDSRNKETTQQGLRDLIQLGQCRRILVNTSTSTFTDVLAYTGRTRYVAADDLECRKFDPCFRHHGADELIEAIHASHHGE